MTMIDTLPQAGSSSFNSDTSPTTGDYTGPPTVGLDVERQNSSVAELRLEPRHLDSSLCLTVTGASPPRNQWEPSGIFSMSLVLPLQGEERPGYFWVHLFFHQSLTSSEFPGGRDLVLFFCDRAPRIYPQSLRKV